MEVKNVMLPKEVSELIVTVSDKKQEEVQSVLQQIFTGTDDWEKQVDAIEVKGISDVMSINLAEVARKNVKQARLTAEKIFDAKRENVQNLKAEFDVEDKLWLKAKQIMQIKFKVIEDKAAWKADFIKRYEAEQKELRTQKRINDVSRYAEINRIEFENMSDDSFNSFVSGLKTTYEAKIEAERKAEKERVEKEQAEKAEKERIAKENERLKTEIEEKAKQLLKEREKIEAERKAIEDTARKEREKIEAERKAKTEAEQKAKNAPDKTKLLKFADQIENLEISELTGVEALKIALATKEFLQKVAVFIRNQTNNL